jgi:hypothetical protein
MWYLQEVGGRKPNSEGTIGMPEIIANQEPDKHINRCNKNNNK